MRRPGRAIFIAVMCGCAGGASRGGADAVNPHTGGQSDAMIGYQSEVDASVGEGDGSAGGGGLYHPVREIPNLASITFWERTGGTQPTNYTFNVDGPELGARLGDPLNGAYHDIAGATGEYYDVYYSDADGTFNLDGRYLTISGTFPSGAPSGGGLNLAEIELTFQGQPPSFGTVIGSYVALGDNADPSRVGDCIDGNLQTHTSMGNTIGTTDRLRITLGFPQTVFVP